jgi:hypothetical protein
MQQGPGRLAQGGLRSPLVPRAAEGWRGPAERRPHSSVQASTRRGPRCRVIRASRTASINAGRSAHSDHARKATVLAESSFRSARTVSGPRSMGRASSLHHRTMVAACVRLKSPHSPAVNLVLVFRGGCDGFAASLEQPTQNVLARAQVRIQARSCLRHPAQRRRARPANACLDSPQRHLRDLGRPSETLRPNDDATPIESKGAHLTPQGAQGREFNQS